eukprot:CAMPEP_0177788178 /NCGR_PEP_ID=MMETSP0491_2-20121128/21951_1 /TAXON_ID=63592 /ORGANISM="Tetraselmis chuii, Strain PLY429" /LENGTH=61 /DNA_ID=CAMNT_0019309705 /DNA_START=15 /DNA_END=196 /DNA_ORIENTATION=+
MTSGALNISLVGLLLQRTVMVAMNGKHPPGHHLSKISCQSSVPWTPIARVLVASAGEENSG